MLANYDRAAIKAQSVIRGWMARKQVAVLKEKRRQIAAVRIQAGMTSNVTIIPCLSVLPKILFLNTNLCAKHCSPILSLSNTSTVVYRRFISFPVFSSQWFALSWPSVTITRSSTTETTLPQQCRKVSTLKSPYFTILFVGDHMLLEIYLMLWVTDVGFGTEGHILAPMGFQEAGCDHKA